MRPLLVAARPRFIRDTPRVPLERGRWRLFAECKVDSTLQVCRESLPPVPLDGQNIIVDIIEKSELFWIEFVNKGKEEYIHVLAEPC